MSPHPKPAGLRLCRPVALWPPCDQERWQRALQRRSIFDEEGGELTNRSTISITKYAKGWGRFLVFVEGHDSSALVLSPGARCSTARVQAYVDHLRDTGNSDRTIINRLQELIIVAGVLEPDCNVATINRFLAAWRSGAQPARSKAHVRPSDELVDLGFRLMAQASHPATLDDAIRFRDGLVIAFLALHPIRRRNLANLHLGRNLLRQSEGFWLTFAPTETKTHEPYEAPVAEVLVEALATYIKVWRPVLLARTGRWKGLVADVLWVSADGSAMGEEGLSGRIKLHTKAAFGKAMSPHRFRDAAASTLVIADPGHIRAAAPLLGHRSLAMTEKHYIQAKGLVAQRSFLEVIAEMRNEKP